MSEAKERKILSILLKGKGILNPCETGVLNDNVRCIREYGVNIFFYTKDNHTVMIDSGYLEYSMLKSKLEEIDIDNTKINEILLTHADPDHAGGIDDRSEMLFKRAKVFLSNTENEYITKKSTRKLLHIKPIRRPIISNDIVEVEDEQIFYIGSIKVQSFLVPGHTKGHMCYLLDDEYLFSGDCVSLTPDGGYSFLWLLNVSNKLNHNSLVCFQKKLENYNVKTIYTAHTGETDDVELFFKYKDKEQSLLFCKKSYDENAPFNLYGKEEC